MLLKVGSRDSKLALIQTGIVIEELKKHYPDWEFEIVKVKTRGDKFLDSALSEVGGKGLFVREIEDAMLCGDIDMAVHSMKDMPYEIPEGLCIATVTKREDPRDVFISVDGKKFADLKEGARIGTSSLRRAVQLKDMRPDIEIVPLRGNVPTRIKKLRELNLAGIVLAAAGLKRLGMEDAICEYFSPDVIVPAVGQGALAVEMRKEDERVPLIKCLDEPDTADAVRAERAFMRVLGGSCKVPMGAYARIEGGILNLTGMIERDGKVKKGNISGKIFEAEEMGVKLAKELGDL
ncbi:MAG: hydroxymethylbilane synthase [Thermoanaerobacteraceae bacterium]|nr:hydroxymethylbilane synthase [Thermoanaerobacteraceae bacterium]